MEKKEYVSSKKECLEIVEGRVCDYCGRKLEAIETVDNAGNPTFWSGCYHGREYGIFTIGTTSDVFKLAKLYILKYGTFNSNTEFYDIEEYKEQQIHKAVEVIDRVQGLISHPNEYRRYKDWEIFRLENMLHRDNLTT